MKSLYKIGLSIIIAVISLIAISFVNFSNIKTTTTGNFVLIGGYVGLITGLSALIPFVYVFWKEKRTSAPPTEKEVATPRERWVRAFADLFAYLSDVKLIDESKVYEAARELVYVSRELAQQYHIKLRRLYQDNAEHLAVQFANYVIKEIKHKHPGSEYVKEMRKDLSDRRIDSPEVVDGALRFLRKMEPYGDVADELEQIFYKAIK